MGAHTEFTVVVDAAGLLLGPVENLWRVRAGKRRRLPAASI
jgi:hypothetical protein